MKVSEIFPITDRPQRRIAAIGPRALNSAELLAVILGGDDQLDIAQELLKRFKCLRALHRADLVEYAQIRGVGMAKTSRLEAAFEVSRRIAIDNGPTPPSIHTPEDAADILYGIVGNKSKEHFVTLILNTRNEVIGHELITLGSVNAAHVRVAEVFRSPIAHMAPAIILGHNHPSGDPSPSPDDVAITKVICEAGELMDIEVLDHLIIGRGCRFSSLKERA